MESMSSTDLVNTSSVRNSKATWPAGVKEYCEVIGWNNDWRIVGGEVIVIGWEAGVDQYVCSELHRSLRKDWTCNPTHWITASAYTPEGRGRGENTHVNEVAFYLTNIFLRQFFCNFYLGHKEHSCWIGKSAVFFIRKIGSSNLGRVKARTHNIYAILAFSISMIGLSWPSRKSSIMVSQCGSTIKSEWVNTVMSWYPTTRMDLRCCQDINPQ